MQVIYEDNHIIIVSKEAGEIVQGDKTGDTPLSETVKQYIKEAYAKPGDVFLGVVHRLDRPVGGIVVFARTSKALTRLNDMFRKGEVHKKYWAVVENGGMKNEECRMKNEKMKNEEPLARRSQLRMKNADYLSPLETNQHSSFFTLHSSFTLVHWLVRNEQQNKSYAYDRERPNAKRAELDYRLLAHGDRYDLLEVNLKTGRHHQIRCQLAHVGMPIKGDLKYGARRSNPDGSISLLARSIDFIHPVSKKHIYVEAPIPDDALWQTLAQGV